MKVYLQNEVIGLMKTENLCLKKESRQHFGASRVFIIVVVKLKDSYSK